jgi:hypothetical protein
MMTVCLGNVRTCLINTRGWLPSTSSLLSVTFWYIRCRGPCVPLGPSSAGQWEPSTVGHTVAPEPPSGGETKLGAARHVAVPEPSRVGSQRLDTWLYRSPSEWGEPHSSWRRGDTGAFPCSGVGKELPDTW